MTTFSVEFLGCKVSQTDAQAVRERLLAGGLHETDGASAVHVVNACCVTHEAVGKSRKAARRALRRGAETVYVTGCGARLDGAFDALGERVIVVRDPAEAVPERIASELGATACVGPPPGLERVRAFLKVQDGCSFSCSFCVIPSVRGTTRSRAMRAILDEGRRRVAAGHRELVVTGVNVGLFRDRAAQTTLPDVLVALAELEGVARVRLSSIEVNHVTRHLCETLAHPRIAPHLHVPLQSGDDRVLADMRRRYRSAEYLRRIELARAHAADLNVTADVIVGYPSEDRPAFARTLALIAEAGISRVHAFPYSPRPDTRTAGRDPVTPAEKRRRSRELRELSDLQGRAWRERKVGVRDRVIVEARRADLRLTGYGADYTPWTLAPDAAIGIGAVIEAIGEQAGAQAVLGRAVA